MTKSHFRLHNFVLLPILQNCEFCSILCPGGVYHIFSAITIGEVFSRIDSGFRPFFPDWQIPFHSRSVTGVQCSGHPHLKKSLVHQGNNIISMKYKSQHGTKLQDAGINWVPLSCIVEEDYKILFCVTK